MKYPFLLLMFLLLGSVVNVTAQTKQLKNGDYQFLIHRSDGQDIVFTALIKDSLQKQIMWIKNGKDELLVDSIIVKHDSVFIELPYFESGFTALINANGDLEGNWIKRAADKVRPLPFTAKYGVSKRFDDSIKPAQNISGRWEITFFKEGADMPAIAEFSQIGSSITGTFLTPYGDYRYLYGVVSGNKVSLSGFDGSYAHLFEATINEESLVHGKFYSGNAAVRAWSGFKNKDAVLPENDESGLIKPQSKPLNFSFPDLDGQLVSLSDACFKDKVIVIQVMGSWCPNCLDETKFLIEQHEKYKNKGVEFVGVSFERTTDFEKSKQALMPFRTKLNPPYPILIPPIAVSDPQLTEKVFPAISKIEAYPTTIFVGKDGFIKQVHAGFDGPATGVHFEKYQLKFEQTIESLLEE